MKSLVWIVGVLCLLGVSLGYSTPENQLATRNCQFSTSSLNDSCNCLIYGPRCFGDIIAADSIGCPVSDWIWHFARADVSAAPIIYHRGAPDRFLDTGDVPGLMPAEVYSVKVMPVLSSGEATSYGETKCLQLAACCFWYSDGPIVVVEVDPTPEIEAPPFILTPIVWDVRYVSLNLTKVDSKDIKLEVYNMNGKRLLTREISATRSSNKYILKLHDDFITGIYMVKFTIGEVVQTEQLVVLKIQ